MTNFSDIMQLIHATNPYSDWDVSGKKIDTHGWGADHPEFERLIRDVRPKKILEIGSWKGRSAINIARLCQEAGLDDAVIVCVDTWLGSSEFWTDHNDPERYLSLGLVHGYPSVYYTFLSNVVHHGFQNCIVPFPVSSNVAATFFKYHSVEFDLVYVDASHEYAEVMSDIRNFWPLVADGKVMFGDDFDYHWLGVMRAVLENADRDDVEFFHSGNKWVYRKAPNVT